MFLGSLLIVATSYPCLIRDSSTPRHCVIRLLSVFTWSVLPFLLASIRCRRCVSNTHACICVCMYNQTLTNYICTQIYVCMRVRERMRTTLLIPELKCIKWHFQGAIPSDFLFFVRPRRSQIYLDRDRERAWKSKRSQSEKMNDRERERVDSTLSLS